MTCPLKIDDDAKSTRVWVPTSTIQKAWDASPTLQSRPDLLDNWLHSPWADGDLVNNPIPGDHVSWSLRDSLNAVNLYNDEKQANDFFEKVNDELDDAFSNGSLKASDKIFITSNANGKSFDEFKGIKLYVIVSIKTSILYSDVSILDFPIEGSSQQLGGNSVEDAEEILNDNLLSQNEIKNDYFIEVFPSILMKVDLSIYQLCSYLIVLLSTVGFSLSIVYQLKNKFKDLRLNVLLGFEILLLGTYLVEIVAISWFTSWLDINFLLYYVVPCYGIISVFEVLCISNLFYLNKKGVFDKITNNLKMKI